MVKLDSRVRGNDDAKNRYVLFLSSQADGLFPVLQVTRHASIVRMPCLARPLRADKSRRGSFSSKASNYPSPQPCRAGPIFRVCPSAPRKNGSSRLRVVTFVNFQRKGEQTCFREAQVVTTRYRLLTLCFQARPSPDRTAEVGSESGRPPLPSSTPPSAPDPPSAARASPPRARRGDRSNARGSRGSAAD